MAFEIIDAEATVCGNCLIVAVNDDRSGMSEDDPEPLSKLGPGESLILGDDREPHFSNWPCDTCEQDLAGDRFLAIIARD